MPKYLTQEYLDLQRSLAQEFPERPGATARLQYVVTGGPDGEVRYYSVLENGKMIENALGDDPDAEVTMTTSYEDSVSMAKGELDANAAFMQGKVKVAGNMGKVMSLLPLTQSPEYKAIADKVNADTEY
jgi:putative sterol carrier protein